MLLLVTRILRGTREWSRVKDEKDVMCLSRRTAEKQPNAGKPETSGCVCGWIMTRKKKQS
ncbi:hypothetical protein I7I48_02798 [Histoplasma ohiense]|nr:hypothetical protein I7I48_02798 [Histoplasma ohiense (nom. inval.)]